MQYRVKYLLIGLSLLLGGVEIWQRLAMLVTPQVQPAGLVAFAGLFALCALSLVGFALVKSGWLRWPLALLLAAASMLVDGYQWAVGDFMNYESFVTMVQSAGDLGSAMAQQGMALLLAAGKAMLVLAIGLKPPAGGGLWVRGAKILALPILLGLSVLLFFRGGEGTSGLPSSHSGASLALLYAYDVATTDRSPRQKVTLKANGPRPASDIVLIIDESIAGAYLDINSPAGVYSGLGPDGAGGQVPVHNFGLATSINHCSVGSNVTLRFGGTRDNYRETVRSGPSIWAYAHSAGLGTVYLDAQRTGGRYQNQMNDAERALIDVWDQFADVPVVDRDHAVADRLASYLNDGKPQLILVNKVGGHFPVSDKFPMSHAQYQPMLKRGKFADVIDMATRDGLDGSTNNWRLYRNSYRNTLIWSVGGFFDRLFASADIGDATILYTSDHGQSFHERGDGGEATHCTPAPQIEEGIVPLVVIGDGDEEKGARWTQAAQAGRDKLSHYRIFPTLLELMGYAAKDVAPLYGPDLFSAKADPYSFNTRFNARLGSEPSWLHVPLDRIARPPVADYEKKTPDPTK
ncbi:sulfatase-like hydrolase/transferase [uncultured Parasphingorhabdus sp.]|uniref:sulfatase-like hydrolase/transferase n=1 Tax=uncultured Parasphingorhabdus sp. TaxID=2709694 RepID=UPI0030D71503|tara:strand:- start:18801 stop:20525 length:1725 start_codon:yes stop_codon:yes gene_type:complete